LCNSHYLTARNYCGLDEDSVWLSKYVPGIRSSVIAPSPGKLAGAPMAGPPRTQDAHRQISLQFMWNSMHYFLEKS